MARRKFWGWGKVGEGFTDEEMKPFEADYAAVFGVDGFEARPFPTVDEIEIAPRAWRPRPRSRPSARTTSGSAWCIPSGGPSTSRSASWTATSPARPTL